METQQKISDAPDEMKKVTNTKLLLLLFVVVVIIVCCYYCLLLLLLGATRGACNCNQIVRSKCYCEEIKTKRATLLNTNCNYDLFNPFYSY